MYMNGSIPLTHPILVDGFRSKQKDFVAPGDSSMEEKGHTISDFNLDELEARGM